MYKGIEQAEKNLDKIAIHHKGKSFTYRELLEASASFAADLLAEQDDLNESRVAFMVNPGFDYVKTLWAIWRAGGIAVPLCLSYPFPSLQYVLEDTTAKMIVVDGEFAQIFQDYADEKGIRLMIQSDFSTLKEKLLPAIASSRRAMILYTSGTTSLPKGVVTTHANIESQVSTLVNAWQWTSADATLCVLPLHHVHGIINVVCCSLYAGASVEFTDGFSAELIYDILQSGRIKVFMAVPTIYYKLISFWETKSDNEKATFKNALLSFRLMVSGSAALPVSTMEKWKEISGHTLLERYGMTEIGMAISNPYAGERKAGYVGIPLPNVSIKLVNESLLQVAPGEAGEILVSGNNVFHEYWNKPAATTESFTNDGWFRTGDIAIVENGYYRILGRNSVDIIKSGGYKISALEIEEVLRTYPSIIDCAVVGIEHPEWGELIVAALVVNDAAMDTKALDTWLRTKMAAYKTPRKYLIVKELPRNAMGKVVKNDVKQLFL